MILECNFDDDFDQNLISSELSAVSNISGKFDFFGGKELLSNIVLSRFCASYSDPILVFKIQVLNDSQARFFHNAPMCNSSAISFFSRYYYLDISSQCTMGNGEP